MTIADVLYLQDLDKAKALLESEGPKAMYDYLASRGYKYAELANGVAKGNSLAGEVAISFMKSTANKMGKPMTDADVDNVRRAMAEKYIEALSTQFDSGGAVVRDINHLEAWEFHSKVFFGIGLTPDAWTLNSVFKVIANDEMREGYWQAVLASAGDLGAELLLSAKTDSLMSLATEVSTPDRQILAREWLDRVDSPAGIGAAAVGGTKALYNYIEDVVDKISFGGIFGVSGSVESAINNDFTLKINNEGAVKRGGRMTLRQTSHKWKVDWCPVAVGGR